MPSDWHEKAMHNLRQMKRGQSIASTPCYVCNVVRGIENVEILEEDDNIAVFNTQSPQALVDISFAVKKHINFLAVLSSPLINAIGAKVAKYCEKLGLESYKILINNMDDGYVTNEHFVARLISVESEDGNGFRI